MRLFSLLTSRKQNLCYRTALCNTVHRTSVATYRMHCNDMRACLLSIWLQTQQYEICCRSSATWIISSRSSSSKWCGERADERWLKLICIECHVMQTWLFVEEHVATVAPSAPAATRAIISPPLLAVSPPSYAIHSAFLIGATTANRSCWRRASIAVFSSKPATRDVVGSGVLSPCCSDKCVFVRPRTAQQTQSNRAPRSGTAANYNESCLCRTKKRSD